MLPSEALRNEYIAGGLQVKHLVMNILGVDFQVKHSIMNNAGGLPSEVPCNKLYGWRLGESAQLVERPTNIEKDFKCSSSSSDECHLLLYSN